ncbi:MAG TPA: GH116 family glycosyl-hydrolase, partial [Puia sp.]|nr:GH116 family glycosyl-hydrolase [Puia sp.]
GNISIAGNGQWKDVEIMNKPGMGFNGALSPKLAPCFMVFTEDAAHNKKTKMLAGPVPSSQFQGMQGSEAPNNGFPRFSTVSFDAAYPFAVVNLDDGQMPISARVRTFNPYIPCDAVSSGIPVAVMRYEIVNKTDQAIIVAVAGSLDNFIGMDGSVVDFNDFDRTLYAKGAKDNRNVFRQSDHLAGIYMSSDSVDKDASAWGTIALTTPDIDNRYKISYRTALDPKGWNADVNDLWDDFSDDGIFKDTVFRDKKDVPHAGLSLRFTLAAHERREVSFFLSWNFPNRKDWSDKVTVGNYYSTLCTDAWDVAEKLLPRLQELENRSLEFVNLFLQSDYPSVVKEAALFNSSTLRSQTTFRTRDGNFFGWEGVFNSTGSCYGNCTHVWNYEQATAFLYGSLAMKMRDIEYHYGLNDTTGLMSFRVSLPLNKSSNWKLAAADGQMGTIMKMYRDWQLSGDDAFLKTNWPLVKKALSFAWIPGGWDADKNGVMEGCQHNTMDIEYYGPNPEIEFWYLGALKAASAMAAYVKDKTFQAECDQLFNSGSKWLDANMYNNEYYIQKIQPVANRDQIAFGLISGMGSKDFQHPDFQIGEGCLVDQLAGQYMAHICGLGWLADSNHLKQAMQSVWKYNYIRSFDDQFNNMRTYGMGDESGLVLTAYPDPARRPKIPLSYCSEAWSGLEYTAATEMIYDGMVPEAIKVITNVRNRYDGAKRNPFNEEECGNHYARAMASWATIIALSRFNYSAVTQKFSMTATPGNYFWSNGYAWGNALVKAGKITISVHNGGLALKSVEIKGLGELKLKQPVVLKEGNSKEFMVSSH